MMQLKKLSWAGIEHLTDRCRLLIGPLENVEPLQAFLGRPHHPMLHIGPAGSFTPWSRTAISTTSTP
jgi:hypothetical protein